MLQAGRIVNVHLPKDRVTQTHQGYGFVEFISEEDAEYAARIMNQVRLYGKPIRVNKVGSLINYHLEHLAHCEQVTVLISSTGLSRQAKASGSWGRIVYWKSRCHGRRESTI